MQKAHIHTKNQVIKTLKKELPRLRERYGVARLALFGSFAKGKARQGSDVDVLVELERPLGLEFVALANELEKTLGRKVDIATFECWRRSFSTPRYRPIAEDVERTLVYVQ